MILKRHYIGSSTKILGKSLGRTSLVSVDAKPQISSVARDTRAKPEQGGHQAKRESSPPPDTALTKLVQTVADTILTPRTRAKLGCFFLNYSPQVTQYTN